MPKPKNADTNCWAVKRYCRRGRRRAQLWRLFIVAVMSWSSLGCPTALQYQANEALVETLGVPQAEQQLQEIMLRSVNPRIIEVQMADDFLHYRYQQPLLGPYGIQTGSVVSENRVYFQHIARIQVFDTHVVFVRAANQQILAQFVFADDQDAKGFADLLSSFRAQRVKQGSA